MQSLRGTDGPCGRGRDCDVNGIRQMDKRIIEGIEACRPLSDDVHAPDLSDVARAIQTDPAARLLYERVQKSDASISAAMEEVPIPPGLAERIVESLGARAPAQGTPLDRAIAAAAQSVDAESESAGEVRPSAGRLSRRQWVGLGVFSTLAAGLLIAGGLFISRPRAEIAFEGMADDWLQALDSHPGAWRTVQPPRDFAIPSAVMAPSVSWQRVALYGPGVAYKLVHAKAGAAMLYVVRLSRPGLPTAPPRAPQSTTGGKAVGYWQSGGLIYVLVVPGDERNYRSFVSSSPVPLA